MLDDLKALLFGRKSAERPDPGFHADQVQLAEAALMFHVIAADGIVTAHERARMHELPQDRYGLGEAQASALIEEGRLADSEAVDLYAFTRTLKRELDAPSRSQIIRNLWQMVYADGKLHEFEDNIVWRIAELIGVESRERMELKRAVREAGGMVEP